MENLSTTSVSNPSLKTINPIARFILKTGVDLILLIPLSILLAIFVNSMNRPIRWLHPSLGLPVIMMSIVIIGDLIEWAYALRKYGKNKAADFIKRLPIIFRDWLPFLLIIFIYENLHDFAILFSQYDIAPFLYQADLWMFGVEPTLWAQKITTPWLTDVMAILYAPYIAYAMILMAFYTLLGYRPAFKQISLAVIFTFILGFICYIVFPALPPRFYIHDLFTNPPSLNGSALHDLLQGTWDGLSVNRGAAFPSLHTALSSVALFYAFRYRNERKLFKITFWIYLPLIVGLWSSTIYLRHHWVPDIFAGWAVAAIACFTSQKISYWTQRYR